MLLSAILGALVGAILGLTGAGGGILAVPALAVGMGWSMQQAAPVALIAIAISAAIGAIEGLRHGLVRYKAAALIALSSFPFVYLGQIIARQLPQAILQACFASVMLLAAYRLYRQIKSQSLAELELPFTRAKINSDSGKFIWTLPTAAILAAIGGTTGLMTGLLGVGGGFVLVPMLRKFTEVSIQGIVATSLLVIALVGASGVAIALMQHTPIPWQAASVFTLTTMLGMLAGRMLIRKIAPARIQTVFALVLALVAAGLLIGAAWDLLRNQEHPHRHIATVQTY